MGLKEKQKRGPMKVTDRERQADRQTDRQTESEESDRKNERER